MRFLIGCVLLCFGLQGAWADETDAPLAPDTAAATMQVPEGFRVSLFAGEPDVMQPIGFCIDDRGRLWVAEAYNYPKHGTKACLLYTSPSPRDRTRSRMPSSA